MQLVSKHEPKFSSADHVITTLGRWIAENRRAEKREAEIRQQVLQELQQQAQDRFISCYPASVSPFVIQKPPSAICFGILGEAV